MTNKHFIFNLLGILAFFLIISFGVMQWLKFYTHHGQKLEIPSYGDQHIDAANLDAMKQSFQIVVNDSVHIVGKPGGLIQNQNPPPGSKVKEGRKIYVTVTKYRADQVDISGIKLYGEDYELKKTELNRKGIATSIKSWVYHGVYEEGSISEVWQGNKQLIGLNIEPDANALIVNKGSRLDFVLNRSSGGFVETPDIIGMTLSQASFLLSAHNLSIGSIRNEGGQIVTDHDDAIITEQGNPSGSQVLRGSYIDVIVQ